MLIYILSFLHNNLKKSKPLNNESQIGLAPVRDAGYISDFAGIREEMTVGEINKRLTNFFEILKKYSVTVSDSLSVFEVIFNNNYNRWLIEKYVDDSKFDDEIVLFSLVNDIIQKDEEFVFSKLENISINIKKLLIKSMFIKIKNENMNTQLTKLNVVC